jgi:toxin YoeB
MPGALEDLKYWKKSGHKPIQKKIYCVAFRCAPGQQLLSSIQETPYEGIGKPEALKHDLSGKWSRRINSEHRIIYDVIDDKLRVFTLKGHY